MVINAALSFSVINITQYLVENTDPHWIGTFFFLVMHGFITALVKYTVFKYSEKNKHVAEVLVRIILKSVVSHGRA